MTTYLHNLQQCPFCRSAIDAASGPKEPEDGDATICYSCENLLIFDKNLRLRVPSEDEQEDVVPSEEFQKILDMVRNNYPKTLH